ncbi:ADP-ribosylation factor GTPase-activating protein AGD12-like [Papaver somniferum]|uniref:ADP-ribosylation factor GTPase-activating protein AGD12-like n=1 Tax=Papaver somniferum TaxID=3469 RepID=UPI000E6F6AF5|nr:ADP-ribosylation factor GTPase-activating protein AGD12-like [Papaver somniferum]
MDSMIEIGGNSSASSTYAFIPVGITKPGADSSHERSSKSISKYWSISMLEMLWCAPKSWYLYFKGPEESRPTKDTGRFQ